MQKERFPRGHWSSLGSGSEKKWYGTYDYKPDGSWNRTAQKILQNFAGSGYPIFRCTSALEREQFRSKGGGKTSIHLNGSTENIELLLHMVISVNQLSLYGAVADMIEELPVFSQKCKPMKSDRETHCKNTSNDLRNYQKTRSYPGLCSEAGLRLVEVGQFFYALPSPRGKANQSLSREYTLSRDHKGTRIKGWIQGNGRFGPVSDIKVCNKHGRYSTEVQVRSLFQDQTVSWIRIVSGIDNLSEKPCRSKRKRKLRGTPVQKRDQYPNRHQQVLGTLTLVEQRQWIDIEMQESKDPHCFQVSKFILDCFDTVSKLIEKKMQESITTKLLMNARKSYPTILDIGQTR